MNDNKITAITNRTNNELSISLDEDENENPIAVLLFQPRAEEFNHYHIELNKDEATRLRDWLTEHLKCT